jgi:sugar/nucleoside kinase (ribokinase family)
MKIVAMTVCTVDGYPYQGIECVGGNSLNFATQCRRSGVEHVSLVGGIGTDDYGTVVLDHLQGEGIDVSHVHRLDGATATNKLYVTEDGERFEVPDSWRGGVYEAFRLSDDDWDFVNQHDIVATTCIDPNFAQALERVDAGRGFVIDFMHIRDYGAMGANAGRISIIFLNGDREIVARVKPIAEQEQALVVVTMDAAGSIALRGRETFFQSAQPVARVVDTTGCGDAYQAAFTVSWFQEGDVQQAMAAGAEAASLVLTHFGGT